MADATQDIQSEPLAVSAEMDLSGVEDLEAVVDQLLSEIDQTIDEIEHSKADPEAMPVDEDDILSGNAVLTDSGEGGALDPVVASAPKPEVAAEADNASMDEQIDQMLDEAESSEGDEAVAEEPEAMSAESIDALDEQLAAQASDALDGDFETIEGDVEAFEPESPATADVSAETSGEAAPAVSSEPVPAPEPAAPEEEVATAKADPVPAVAEASGSGGGGSGVTVLIPGSGIGILAHPVVQRIASITQRVMTPVADVMSIPLRLLEPKMRDTVGWVAVNTMFLAMCIWLILLLG